MATAIVKIARHYQVVIPKEIREKFHLKEGDLVSFQKREGEIAMIPVEIIKKDQIYFWSRKWQKAIKKSEKEIEKGYYKTYQKVKELKKDIEK